MTANILQQQTRSSSVNNRHYQTHQHCAMLSHPGVLHHVQQCDNVGTPTEVLKDLNLTFDLLFLHRLWPTERRRGYTLHMPKVRLLHQESET